MAALSPLCFSFASFLAQPLSSLRPATVSPSILIPIRRRQFSLLPIRAAVSGKETPAPKGIRKPAPITPELQAIVGVPEIPRTQALKHIWAYIKEHQLQDPNDKKIIICDEKLKKLFGKEQVGFLEITKLLNPHFKK